MRDPHFANNRFDETSMGADTYIIGLMTSARHLTPRGFGLHRFVGKVVHSTVAFAKAVFATGGAAYLVTHLADRYYTMNNSELASIGLTRDQIPVELRRVLCADRGG